MTRQVNYKVADFSTTPGESLLFHEDTKSRRALAASRVAFQPGAERIEQETLCQIVELVNITESRAQQLDEMLAAEDVENVGADRRRFGSGERVIRAVNLDEEENRLENTTVFGIHNNNSYFKLTLQDCFGNMMYAIELEKLGFLSSKNLSTGFPIQLGGKLLINNAEIIDRVILLSASTVEFLGGFVQDWNVDLAKKHISYQKSELSKIKQDHER